MALTEREKVIAREALKKAQQTPPAPAASISWEEFDKLSNSTSNTEAPANDKSFVQKAAEVVPNLAVGFAKGAGSTLAGASKLGEKYLLNPIDRLMGNKVSETSSVEELGIDKSLEATNTTQKIGKGIEQIVEFLIPGSASVKAGKAAKVALGGSKLAKAAGLGTRAITEAGIVGGQTAIQQGQIDDKAKTTAIVAALFPVAGAGLTSIKLGAGKVGQKIEQSVIRPSAEDIKDGFNIQNLAKYKVGGSIKEVIANTHIKLNELGQQLKNKLAGSNASLNLNSIFEETSEDLLKNKGVNFGNVTAIKRVLEDQLKPEILEQAGQNGLIDLVEANFIKRGAGTKGAWAYGRVEPDASAVERVYTTFYNKLKTAIEKNAPEGVKELNKQMSDLIPISNAALRRLPVEQRNNMISLTDSIGLFSAIFDPRSLALLGANRLAKSGKFGNFLMNVAESVKKPSATSVGKRIFGN
jgi:hypothetical protein